VSAELLEFLGGFETSTGKSVDPQWFVDDADMPDAETRTQLPPASQPKLQTPHRVVPVPREPESQQRPPHRDVPVLRETGSRERPTPTEKQP
jgi:hypothetical protein